MKLIESYIIISLFTLNDILTDQLTCGISDDSIQHYSVSERHFTFDTALETAMSTEAAKKSLQRWEPLYVYNLTCTLLCVGKMTYSPDRATANCMRFASHIL